jgi:hypothetical protein
MSKETIRQTIDQIKTTDSMKAVKVAFDLSESVQDSVSKVMQVVSTMDNNMKLLATKVLELEQKLNNTEKALDLYETDLTKLDKKVEGLEAYANREI